MSDLQTTNEEIRRRIQNERRRREQRRRAEQPIRAIDALLAELEQLHLDGRKRVPESFDARFAAMLTTLPADVRVELRSRVTIVHTMDRLYAIQDQLLARRTGERRRRYDLPDDDDFLPQAS